MDRITVENLCLSALRKEAPVIIISFTRLCPWFGLSCRTQVLKLIWVTTRRGGDVKKVLCRVRTQKFHERQSIYVGTKVTYYIPIDLCRWIIILDLMRLCVGASGVEVVVLRVVVANPTEQLIIETKFYLTLLNALLHSSQHSSRSNLRSC